VALQKIWLLKLCTLSAFLVCFSVIFGVGPWFKIVPQEVPSAPVVIATLAAQPPPVVSASDSSPLDAEMVTAQPWPEVSVPNPSRLLADMMAVPRQIGMTPTADQIATPEQHATFVGVWAPDASSCSLQNFKDGLLPTVMNLDGASAGDTFCSFKNLQNIQAGWRMDALCSNKQEQWSTRVHLNVNGDRMIWKSKRGSQTYTRCMNDLRMAQMH
jgi:hypothetical protein